MASEMTLSVERRACVKHSDSVPTRIRVARREGARPLRVVRRRFIACGVDPSGD